MGSILSTFDAATKAQHERMEMVKVFLRDVRMPAHLRAPVLAFFKKQRVKSYDTRQVLSQLPFELRAKVVKVRQRMSSGPRSSRRGRACALLLLFRGWFSRSPQTAGPLRIFEPGDKPAGIVVSLLTRSSYMRRMSRTLPFWASAVTTFSPQISACASR